MSTVPTGIYSPDHGFGHNSAYCVDEFGDVNNSGWDQGGASYSYGQADYWWLRSPGLFYDDYDACFVRSAGSLDFGGDGVRWNSCGNIYFSIMDMTPT